MNRKLNKFLSFALAFAFMCSIFTAMPAIVLAVSTEVAVSGTGVMNANRVNIRPNANTRGKALGKASKGDEFSIKGFVIPKGYSYDFFKVAFDNETDFAYIAGNYLNAAFDVPMQGEITKKGFAYSAKSTAKRYRAGAIAAGDVLPLFAREGKWWRSELDGEAVWVPTANVQKVSAPRQTLTLTPSTTEPTYGGVKITVTGAEGARFVGWRRASADAAFTDEMTFKNDITAAKQFDATSNGWYAVCMVNAQGQFSYRLIQITNIKTGSGGTGSATPPVPPAPVAVTGVTLNVTTAALTPPDAIVPIPAGQQTLTATVQPANATNKGVTWSSDSPNVIVAGGLITAVSPGPATITVTTLDGGKTASCTVTVLPSGSSFNFGVFSAGGTAGSATGAFVIPEVINGGTVTIIDGSAFEDTNITSVTIPNTVTVIRSRAFEGCTALSSVTLPSGLLTIGSSAFEGCTALSSVTLPSGLLTIGFSAFESTAISTLDIPASVTAIGTDAFNNTPNLISACFWCDRSSFDNNIFYGSSAALVIQYDSTKANWPGAAFNAGTDGSVSVTPQPM